jgi:chromosome segregation ATPase
MPEIQHQPETPRAEHRGIHPALLVGAVVIVGLFAAGLYLILNLRDRVSSLEDLTRRQSRETRLMEEKLHLTDQNLEAGMQSLGSRLGMNEEAISKRTAELRAQQQRSASRLAAAQQATSRKVSEVDTEVSGVKTELGGAQSDLAHTRTDLAATNAKLESAIGDLNVHSGLIAKNHDELEYLKHRGDRNYYEFTLRKKQRRPISTVSLELKKTDPKHSRFTLNVYADDRVYEKKNRNLDEPLQFYTGRDRQLYEVVVFSETKNQISGYLSTPK